MALLLALVLPLKALAAAVIPITGLPDHHSHQHVQIAQHTQLADHVAAPCDHATDADSKSLHEHACPHLGMASAPVTILALDISHRAPCAHALPTLPLTSIVLAVPHPPPTALT